jgi:hypothetical protein
MLLGLAQAVEEESTAYMIGRFVGLAVIVILVILFVRSRINK